MGVKIRDFFLLRFEPKFIKRMAKLAMAASFLLLTFLFGQFAWLSPSVKSTDASRFDEKANLALRRMGHYLLLASGDSTSRISAVKKLNDNTYILQLNQSFDYDKLPKILEESFKLHKIKSSYDVAVLDCKTNELQLGYNFLDYAKNNEVACGGRQQRMGCYNVKVTFDIPKNQPKSIPIWWTLGLGIAFIGASFLLWRKKTVPISETPDESEKSPTSVHFGNSSMDIANQLLYSGKTQHDLTYREAKLLQLFIKHQNQVLERNVILKSVWGDEGVIVGRSVDVFVSRLRKLFQEDTSLKITAVHGVGYRLEVSNANEA